MSSVREREEKKREAKDRVRSEPEGGRANPLSLGDLVPDAGAKRELR